MKHSSVELNDLPDEILMIILKKLCNVEVLYSLKGVNKRLNVISHDPIFTNRLTLMKRVSDQRIDPLSDSILDQFCLQILPEIHHKIKPEQVELIRRDYVANDGWETFLAYEDPEQDILIGLLRLRKCTNETFRPELKRGQVSIVRELHVYGSVVPVHAKDPSKFQHQVCRKIILIEDI